MKTLKLLSVLAVVTCALTLSAKADLMFLGFTAFENPNSPDANAQALADFLGVDVSTLSIDLATGNHENLNGADTTISVTPGQFVVAHYGGPGGGSLEFFQVINLETSVVVPGSPNPADDLANPESLSSARVFTGSAPDSGTTAMLLGGALAGLSLMRRYLKR
jgi:VPDSG-CTERM motif